MKKDVNFIEKADAYIRGDMNEAERREFENYCKENPADASKFDEHILLLKKLNAYQNRIDFRSKLESIQSRLDIPQIKTKSNSNMLVSLWKNYGYSTLIA